MRPVGWVRAFHEPTRDESHLLALAEVVSPVRPLPGPLRIARRSSLSCSSSASRSGGSAPGCLPTRMPTRGLDRDALARGRGQGSRRWSTVRSFVPPSGRRSHDHPRLPDPHAPAPGAGGGRRRALRPRGRRSAGGQVRPTGEERRALLPSGRQPVFRNRVAWAVAYLAQAGLLERTRRGYFRITDRGREVLRDRPERPDVKYLERFPDLQEFRRRRRVPGDPLPRKPHRTRPWRRPINGTGRRWPPSSSRW